MPRPQFEETMRELTELLELGDLVKKPARTLSLGERMKCELAAALVHRPRVLFLDEPTIGLDVSMQATVRGFVERYNERYGATILLTSHYMEDVQRLCPRVIVIDKGKLVYDGALDAARDADPPGQARGPALLAPRGRGPTSRASARWSAHDAGRDACSTSTRTRSTAS